VSAGIWVSKDVDFNLWESPTRKYKKVNRKIRLLQRKAFETEEQMVSGWIHADIYTQRQRFGDKTTRHRCGVLSHLQFQRQTVQHYTTNWTTRGYINIK
jgi:hypothetical protein